MTASEAVGRRERVLESALLSFARFGYRKTSMDEVARAAEISRPGLYFLFSSKQELFRAAATHALARDLAAAERSLASTAEPLRHRIVDAFDHWAGRYVGPARDVEDVVAANPDLLGEIVETAPARFRQLIVDALARTVDRRRAVDIVDTLISTSVGVKHQVETRDAYRRRLAVAVHLLVPA